MHYSKELFDHIKNGANEKHEYTQIPTLHLICLLGEITRLQSVVDAFNTGFVNSKHVEPPEPPFRKSIDARGNEIELQFEDDE